MNQLLSSVKNLPLEEVLRFHIILFVFRLIYVIFYGINVNGRAYTLIGRCTKSCHLVNSFFLEKTTTQLLDMVIDLLRFELSSCEEMYYA